MVSSRRRKPIIILHALLCFSLYLNPNPTHTITTMTGSFKRCCVIASVSQALAYKHTQEPQVSNTRLRIIIIIIGILSHHHQAS